MSATNLSEKMRHVLFYLQIKIQNMLKLRSKYYQKEANYLRVIKEINLILLYYTKMHIINSLGTKPSYVFFPNLYKFIMQIQDHKQLKQNPFDIVYNARSSRATRSRKSSVHNLQKIDKERPINKKKKLRKMTLNPEIFRYQEIKQIEEMQNEHKPVRSEKGQKQQFLNVQDFLQLGGPIKTQSKKEQQLQNGIFQGIGHERELDSDFDLSGGAVWLHNPNTDLQMHQ